MDATLLPPDAPLPQDVGTLQAMVRQLLAELGRLRQQNAEMQAELQRLREENADLRRQLDAARKHRFGRRSERERKGEAEAEGPEPPDKEKKPKKRHQHGRSPLPEHLERRTVLHDLSGPEKLCPCCGQMRELIGEQVTEQLSREPFAPPTLRITRRPASIFEYEYEDFEVEGYQHHPAIRAAVAV